MEHLLDDAVSPSTGKSSGQARENLERRGAKMCRRPTGGCARSRLSDSMARLGRSILRKRFGTYLWSTAAGSPDETMADVPKVALDFLPRPARMTSAAFRYQAFHKTGETHSA